MGTCCQTKHAQVLINFYSVHRPNDKRDESHAEQFTGKQFYSFVVNLLLNFGFLREEN